LTKRRATYDSTRAKSRRASSNPTYRNKTYKEIIEFCNKEVKPSIYSLSSKAPNQLDSHIKNQLKRFLIIELVSVFENYFKYMTAYYVDKNKVDLSILFEDTITFKLSELETVLDDARHTRGNIIVSSLKFDGLDKVNKIVSKLLDIDFFKYLYEENTHDKCRMMVKGPPIDINFKNLYEAFELRNKVVHELEQVTYNYTKIVGLWDNVMNIFDIATTIFMSADLLERFRDMYGRNINI
jgi:hypothetical protein